MTRTIAGLRFRAGLFVLACSASAFRADAQTNAYTPIFATQLSIGNSPIVTGKVVITPYNAVGQPISGGIVAADGHWFGGSFTASITNGAIANGFTVPDQRTATATTANTPVSYQVQILSTSPSGVSTYIIPAQAPYLTGSASVGLDQYKAAQVASVPAGNIFTWSAIQQIPTRCSGPQFGWLTVSPFTTYECQSGSFAAIATSSSGGSSLTWSGAWSSTSVYAVNQAVLRNGSTYVALQASTNQDPATATAYWQLVAQAGANGTNGTNGTNGSNGANAVLGAYSFSAFPSTGLIANTTVVAQTDAVVGSSCTQGGGTMRRLCLWNGSAWVPADNIAGEKNVANGLVGLDLNGQSALAQSPVAGKYAQGVVIYDKSYWADTSDFTTFGTTTLTATSGKLVSTASNVGTFINGFYLKNTSNNDDEIDVEVTMTNGQGASTSYGLAVGKVASNPSFNQWGMASTFNPYGSNFFAQSYYVQPGGASSQLSTVTGGAVTNGGTYKLVYSQRGTRFTAIVYDYALGAVTNSPAYVPMTNCSPKFPNSDYVGFFNNGGTYTIQSIRVISRKPQQPELAVIGDSKAFGCAAGSRETRFTAGLSSVGPVAVYSGSGDTTQSVLNDLPYILANKPKRVLLNIGRNDLANSVPAATWQANYVSIVSQLKTAGVVVTHLLPIPENVGQGSAIDQSALKTYIQTTFAADQMIDPAVGFNVSTMLRDNIHPNELGNALISSLITASGFFPSAPLRPYTVLPTEMLYPPNIY